jgi:alpha-D-ribose 1-methylphosphonate 5-triphosphate diphosphatase PhnM
MTKRRIAPADIMPMAEYGKIRHGHRKNLVQVKKNRRLEVGPFATFHFENYDTMWAQVHEMLFIEKGGDEQLAGELESYNPLIPQGRELIATMLIEIEDEIKRARILATLGHIEDMVSLSFAGETVKAAPADTTERTTAEGKTSAVHFLRFVLTETQAAKFKAAGTQVLLGIAHANYGHIAVMPEATRAELARDLA